MRREWAQSIDGKRGMKQELKRMNIATTASEASYAVFIRSAFTVA
jgi:hypothetical protein